MRSEPNHVTRCLAKIDRDHKPKVIALDIKDQPVIIHNTGIAINLLQLIKVAKLKL